MKRASLLESCTLLFVTIAVPSAVTAEIYKCVQDGKTVYQDQACRGSGGAVTISTPETTGAAPAAARTEESLSRLRANVDAMAHERRKRDIAYEVSGFQRAIREYEQAETVELAALADRKGYNYHNLNAAMWQRESIFRDIDSNMRAVTEKYAALKQAARDRISRLQKEAADIDKPAGAAPPSRAPVK
jgi:hypothetical protein